MEPKFGRILGHAGYHVFNLADQLPPATGTLRLYVDGTAGNDLAAGTSWATAWKTCAKVESAVSSILSVGPTTLQVMVYFRGAFANENLRLCGTLAGATNVHLIHHVDDWTEIASGTIATVAAASSLAGTSQAMRQITVAGFVLNAATHNGAWIVVTDGTGKRLTYQILRVFDNGGTPTATISTTSAPPAWVTGATVSVREPSVSGITLIHYALQYGQSWDASVLQNHNVVLGMRCGSINAISTQGLSFVVKATTATAYVSPIFMDQTSYCESQFSTAFVPVAQAQEWGIIGTNTTEACQFGSWTTTTASPQSDIAVRGSSDAVVSGYFGTSILWIAQAHGVVRRANAMSTGSNNGAFSHANVIIRGAATYGVESGHGSFILADKISFVDLPASGLTGGLLRANKGGWLQISSAVDGNNTGAGAGLYAIVSEKGSKVQCESGPGDSLKGDDGIIRSVDGIISFAGNISWGAKQGDGPDIYIEGGTCYFAGTFAKTARNTTASAVLQAVRNAKVTQATGKAFTIVTPPSGVWTTDFGAKGPIIAEDGLVDMRLGNLTGGIAGNTGIACTVKNASRLVHGGVGLSGVTPLDLGGLPGAVAWPAAGVGPYDDSGAVVPQGCWCIPGV